MTQSEAITYLAVNDKDEICEKTMSFLVEIVASFVQKMALISLPTGGIFIGGGVSNYLSDFIVRKQQLLWDIFLENPMSEAVLEMIPIYVMKENPTLDGLEAMIMKKSKTA